MYTTTRKQPSKVRPGLSLSSHQIRSRLKNKTIQKQHPGNESFIQDEELLKIQKMSKVEREMAYRENLKEIEATQKRLEKSADKKKQQEIERRIDKLANERMQQIRQDEAAK